MDSMYKLGLIVVVVAVGGLLAARMFYDNTMDSMYEEQYGEPPP